MKTKQLLFAIALPLALTACTNEEFGGESMSTTQKGELVTLPENYLLTGYMGSNIDTRSIYDETRFAWLPFDGTTPDAIGLCWRGGEYTSNPSVVYTNYKFEHYGWLGKGETKPAFDCDGNLDNGQLLTALSSNKSALLAGTWDVANTSKYADLKVDGKNGLFSTTNSTIFKGDYIVYYPYNDKFNEVGNIPVTAPTNIKRDVYGLTDNNYTTELAKEVFVAGVMNGIDGGQQNGIFSTNFVSGGIVVKINNKTQTDFDVHKVILLSENGFATEAKLDASKVATGVNGAGLYAGEPTKFANTLVAEFYDSNNSSKQADLTVATNATQRVAFAALPTTSASALKNAKVILIDKNEKSFMVDAKLTSVVSLSEGWNTVNVDVDGEFTDNAYAYDTESLITLLTAHNTKTDKGQTIEVLNKITLDPNYEFTLPYGDRTSGKLSAMFKNTTRSIFIAENVKLTGKGSVVVPANLQLVFRVVGDDNTNKPVLTFDIPLIVENKGCCGSYNGTVVFQTRFDANAIGRYHLKSIKNEGTIYLGSDKAGIVDITVNELDNNGGYINAYGMGNNDNTKASSIKIEKLKNTYVARDTQTDEEKLNNGRVNIVAKFWNPEDEGKETAAVGTKKRVNMTIGQLENNANAYILVGKRTIMNVTGASTNVGKIKVETANVTNNEEDAQLYISTAATITNNGLIENFGVINNEGSLKNNDAAAVIVDHVGCQFGGQKAQATPGEYICDVEDEDVSQDGDRLGYAMGENMPTTTIRFVGDGTTKNATPKKYTYELNGYKTGDILPYNFIIAAKTPVELKTKSATAVTIDGKLAINEGSSLNLSAIQLTVNKVVTVDGTMKVSPTAANAATLESKIAFTAKDDVNVKNMFEIVKFAKADLKANLAINKDAIVTFNYATYTDVAKTININGTFVRVVSSGNQSANPAQVWCADYTKSSSATIPNGLPQKR